MNKPRTPSGLSQKAARFWRDVVTNYRLRPDELRVLEDACREVDLVDTLRKAMASSPLFMTGSMGQQVINPIIPELRQHRATLATLLRFLKIPDGESGLGHTRSTQARDAAMSRWQKRRTP
ncbi:MAG: hypothetical protein QOD10_3589 [Mycobacterium sp.]|jgi:hypothetical protein|nr:hypothetical protein [Mycobacterium sp.]